MQKIIINNNKIGKNIKKIRLENKYSYKEFAKILDLSSLSTIFRWEKGESTPSLENIIKICNMFNVKIDDLVEYSIIL